MACDRTPDTPAASAIAVIPAKTGIQRAFAVEFPSKLVHRTRMPFTGDPISGGSILYTTPGLASSDRRGRTRSRMPARAGLPGVPLAIINVKESRSRGNHAVSRESRAPTRNAGRAEIRAGGIRGTGQPQGDIIR